MDPLHPDINHVLDFLTKLFHTGIGYSALNTARSAVSALCSTNDCMTLGAHPLVKRFMRGVFNLRPTKPRYSTTWDVNRVLEFLQSTSPVELLPLKDLTRKLAMLIALSTAARSQTLSLLSLSNMTVTDDGFSFTFDQLLKQSRPGYVTPNVRLRSYTPDTKLCVCSTLQEYLVRTKALRGDVKQLFISYVKPFRPVSSSTISRWIRDVMQQSGIDIDQFKPHSVRAATTSKAKASLVPIDHILKTAGWSSGSTFAKFYDKPVQQENTFAQEVLKC